MDAISCAAAIRTGETALGIELGSTRIKAVLISRDYETIAQGSYAWENSLADGHWTYSLEEAWHGVRTAYAKLKKEAEERSGEKLRRIGSLGISGMMHGYLAFDAQGELLVPFRTWRNNTTEEAAARLTREFSFNIPERWSIAHLYQALLSDEAHTPDVAFITTLSGYIHWKLSGEKAIGIGDASGMFPIAAETGRYDENFLAAFSALPRVKKHPWRIEALLPRVLSAGEEAGRLTEEGAALLDESGDLLPGVRMAPPEGDAGTGMVATNSVRKRTGNISAGTSIFSMNVLERPLKDVYRDIDMVTTPDGAPVAMVHSNNCTSDINAWAAVFGEFSALLGHKLSPDELYPLLFQSALQAESDAGGLVNYSFLSGENLTRTQNGRPLFLRTPKSRFTLANFMLAHLYAAFAPLRIGFDILTQDEGLTMESMVAHGGIFRTPVVAQQALANMLVLPVTVTETAAEGGPWGMAVLAAYAAQPEGRLPLADFLAQEVFPHAKKTTLVPEPIGVQGAEAFLARYLEALPVEQTASGLLLGEEAR